MSRTTTAVASRLRRKKTLKLAKGFFGRAKNCFKIAIRKVEKGMQYNYIHRKQLKRDMRRLWIVRINAQCRNMGMKYNEFMHALKLKDININRKMLSELCIRDVNAFNELINQVKN